jgi:hypothetical protein
MYFIKMKEYKLTKSKVSRNLARLANDLRDEIQ